MLLTFHISVFFRYFFIIIFYWFLLQFYRAVNDGSIDTYQLKSLDGQVGTSKKTIFPIKDILSVESNFFITLINAVFQKGICGLVMKVFSLGLWRFQILSSMGFSLTKIAYHLSRFLCKHFTRKEEPSLIHDWASIRNWKMEELTLQDRYLRIDKILFFPWDLFCHQYTLFYKLVS